MHSHPIDLTEKEQDVGVERVFRLSTRRRVTHLSLSLSLSLARNLSKREREKVVWSVSFNTQNTLVARAKSIVWWWVLILRFVAFYVLSLSVIRFCLHQDLILGELTVYCTYVVFFSIFFIRRTSYFHTHYYVSASRTINIKPLPAEPRKSWTYIPR